jgi:multisubunit Na+/H+ antiporter MnhF subunit
MQPEPIEQATKSNAATEEAALYRQGLCRNWTLRYGQRPDSLSRLSGLGDAGALLCGAIALALYWTRSASLQTLTIVIGAAIVGLVASHAMNRYFLKLEKLAFLDVEKESAGAIARHPASASPFYALAKLAMKPRVRAKVAWVERRMENFLARRAHKERQAEIFEKHSIKLGSIHGTADAERGGDSLPLAARSRWGRSVRS